MKLEKKKQAVEFRKQGYSMKEIAERLQVSKSSVSLWVRSVPLSLSARKRLNSIYTAGQIASQEAHKRITVQKEAEAKEKAEQVISTLSKGKNVEQLVCAMLYWCEGSKMYKRRGTMSFTNSDPVLIKTFLRLLRGGFEIDESKFSVCVHLHSYHDEEKQLKFWSKTTNIPLRQFMRPYWKKETGQSIRDGYQGCIQVRYYDTKLLRYILAIAKTYMARMQDP